MLDQVLHINKSVKFSMALSLSTGLTGLTFIKLRINHPVCRINKYVVMIGPCNFRLLSHSIVNNRTFSLDFCNFTTEKHRPFHLMPSRNGRKTNPIFHPSAKGVGGSSHAPATLPEETRPGTHCMTDFHDK
jgi:hypothetical protein